MIFKSFKLYKMKYSDKASSQVLKKYPNKVHTCVFECV